MSVTPSSHVVGMFTERASADNAVEALHNAGFEDERISYSTPGTSGGFFEDLKSLFTGTNPGADNLIHNLTDMGLSSEQAQYYADEYNNGNTILVVNAPSREEQVLGILHEYGAYSAHSAGVRFGGAQAAATGSVSPAADATQPSGYASTQAEPADYTTSEASIQHSDPDLGTQSQFQYQSASNQPLTSQPQDATTPITPLHDVEDQPTRPITSEYATEPHHTSDEVTTHEYNVENGTGLSDLVAPQHEHESLTAQSPVGTSSDQIEDRLAQPAMAAPDYATPEDQVVHSAATTSNHETAEEPAIHSAATTSDYETAGEHPAQPLTATSEYATAEDQIVHPATTTHEYETAGEPAVQSATTTHEYEMATDRASYASVTTPEDRTENQMAEPTSVAPEHEIEEGLPAVGAAVTNQTAEDQTVSPAADVYAYSATEEPLLSRQGIAGPEPAIIEQTGQPEAVLTTHDVAQQQGTLDSAVSSEPESVTQEQPILDSTMPPVSADTLDSTVTSASAVAASQPETVTTQPAQTNLPVVDYAAKLQSLQQQLQVSQQQLQEAKARLQAAKEHETQIQSTQQQLKAIQDELAATHAELNETHSRIDQY